MFSKFVRFSLPVLIIALLAVSASASLAGEADCDTRTNNTFDKLL